MRALPDELTIKESEKDGLGLFAKCDIVFFPHSVCNIYHPYLGWLRTAVGAFLNHSDTPNCVVYETSSEVKLHKLVTDLELQRYLLGTDTNFKEVYVSIKIRYLVQKGTINAGDEITVSYEDLKHHGIRSIQDPGFFATAQEAGEAKENYAVRIAANGKEMERVG